MSETTEGKKCFSCDSYCVKVSCDKGPHYAKWVCMGCQRFNGFIPKVRDERVRRRNSSKQLYAKYETGYCELCLRTDFEVGLEGGWMEAHHVKPYAEEGDDERENLWMVCNACHKLIHHTRTYHGHNEVPK